MRLMRIGAPGAERPVVAVGEGRVVDVSDLTRDFDGEFFATVGAGGLATPVAERTAAGRVDDIAGERVGSPIARPHQIVGVGMNFADHAAEIGEKVPTEPLIFSKSPNSLSGPFDDLVVPRESRKTDYEVELGVVLGRRAFDLESVADAVAAVAGFVLVNDVSEREFQKERSGQFMKGKSAPSFCPVGPWLATPDEFTDLSALRMTSHVDGELRQDGSTGTMVFDPHYLVRYVSRFLCFEAGDLLLTGTPPGVGAGFDPPRFVAPGSIVEVAVEGLGAQRQRAVAAS